MAKKVVDLEKERRIQGHLEALATAIQESPRTAQWVADQLNEGEDMESKSKDLAIRIPRDLIGRALNVWDKLLTTPELKASPPRKSSAAAVRLALLRGVEGLERQKEK